MRKPFLLLALAAASTNVAAAWVSTGKVNDTTGYADPATIRKTGANVTMWSLLDFKTPQKDAADPKVKYLSQKVMFEYDCSGRQMKLRYVSFREKNMGKGEVVGGGEMNADDWQAVPPGSGTEKMWKIACRK